jgi:hypothetical protein
MKKINKKVSLAKAKRYIKNKKRLSAKPNLSKFERNQAALREQIKLSAGL